MVSMTETFNGFAMSDVSGQKTAKVRDVEPGATISELIRGFIAKMDLPRNDAAGRPLTYHALLEREGRHLHGSERVQEVVQPGDMVILQPNIDAGGRR